MSFRLIPTDQRLYELFADQAAVAAARRVLEADLRDYIEFITATSTCKRWSPG